MPWNNSIFPLLIVTSGGGFTGLFIYSPAPGTGNLIASITAASGTDPYGNAYQAGVTTYAGTLFAQLLAGELGFKQSGDIAPSIILGGGGALSLQSGQGTVTGRGASGLQLAQSLTSAGAPRIILSSNASAPALLGFVQGTAGPNAGDVDRPILTWLPSRTHLSEIDTQNQEFLTGHATLFSTTDQPITLTTFSTVCGSIAAGIGTYRVRASMTCQQGPNVAANDYRLGFTGTISQVRVRAEFMQDNTSVFVARTTSNNGLLASHAYGATTVYEVEINGIIVTTSTGTLSIQAAMDAAGDTFTVLALSFFHVEPVT